MIKHILITLAVGVGCGIFESLWRRWFGGGLSKLSDWWEKHIKWLSLRLIKHAINISALFCAMFFWRNMTWYWSIYAALVMQILFWTMTFGMYFDIGRHGKPVTEEDIKAYNKPWFSFILNWCFTEERYTDFYDYCGMMIRFTWPLLLMFWLPTFNSGILFLGPLVALVYGLGWVMKDKNLLKKLGPTEIAEFAAGFMTGAYIGILGLI